MGLKVSFNTSRQRRALRLLGVLVFVTVVYLLLPSEVPEERVNMPSVTSIPPAGTKAKPYSVEKDVHPLYDKDDKPLPLPLALGALFPYDPIQKLPKYIWQTWKVSPSDDGFPAQFRQAHDTWSRLHGDYVHELVTDAMTLPLLHHLYAAVPDVIKAYEALPMPVLKADFFRYLILLARGGVYSDIDTHALKPAVDWVPDALRQRVGLVVGIEADPDREDWADWYSRRIQFCQWTILAKPGHPILRDVVVRITEETLKRKHRGTLHKDQKGVVEFTGPAIWSDVIMDYFDSTTSGGITWESFTLLKSPKRVNDVVVLPITGFSPGVGQMGSRDTGDPQAMVRHTFEGSWKPESERMSA